MVFWSSEKINPFFLEFTSGEDLKVEGNLIQAVKKSLSLHAKNLEANRLITKEELGKALKLIQEAELELLAQNEDCHTALFEALKKMDSTLANKLRAFKSRNEEVAVSEAFFFLAQLDSLEKSIGSLLKVLKSKSRTLKGIPWIGFTHTRMATVGKADDWLNAYAEQLSILRSEIPGLRKVLSQVSMGSGPGFGSGLKIKHTSGLKNCSNPQLMQHLRVLKHQEVSQFCLKLSTLFARFSSDVVFYGSDNNGHILLSSRIAQGSSAMPHKLNPDLFEIIRANHLRFQAWVQFSSHHGTLISGYHRDYQLSKEAGISSILLIQKEAEILRLAIPELRIGVEKIKVDVAHNQGLNSFSELSRDSIKGKDLGGLYDKLRKG